MAVKIDVMNETEIRQTIFQLLKKIAPDTEPEKLKADDDIRHTLEIDSFDALQLVVALDEHFGIETRRLWKNHQFATTDYLYNAKKEISRFAEGKYIQLHSDINY